MRAPSASGFKVEIAAYRNRLTTDPAPINVQNRWRYEFTMEILDKWENHPDAEKFWLAVAPLIEPQCTPGEFIAAALRDRLQAEELSRIQKKAPAVGSKMRHDAKRYAQDFQNSDRFAARVLAFNEFREHKGILGRKQTEPRTRFMSNWRAHFERLFGKPHDHIVASLTNILFNLADDDKVTADAVRAAANRMASR